MSALIDTIKPAFSAYGRAAALALFLHALLLAVVLTADFTPVTKPKPAATPVMSYLYQPPAALPADAITEAVIEKAPPPSEQASTVSQQNPSLAAAVKSPPVAAKATPVVAQMNATEPAATTDSRPAEHGSLVLRALNRAGTGHAAQQAAMANAAGTAYQQFLRNEQQPAITVERQHQQLPQDPAMQVLAQLNDGRQIIRSKVGCRIADPAKDGFDGLMAAKSVPCGDEISNSELLKQALKKHSKR